MAINLTKAAVAVGVGAVDEVLERSDNKNGRTGWKRWSTLARAAGSVGGLMAGEFMPRYAAIGETVGIATTPLFVKELAAMFVPATSGAAKTGFAPRNISVRNWIPSGGNNGMGAYRPLA